CNGQIVGPRFKCAHPSCPDFDLCENCEALPQAVHPRSHPLLKLVNPIETYQGTLTASGSNNKLNDPANYVQGGSTTYEKSEVKRYF
ncbi:hypothetical protein FRB90_009844, partial [Tulasnella sp. 427]